MNFYDPEDYLHAMKRFQKETRGMLPHSDEWRNVRNRIYSELGESKKEKQAVQRKAKGG